MFTRAGIVGRPNVGKSTLFNCLLGRTRAIVGDFAGVTRDYKEELLELKNFSIQLVDTAGLKSSLNTEQDKMINWHTLNLINQLDIILFVIDGREGITLEDKEIFQICNGTFYRNHYRKKMKNNSCDYWFLNSRKLKKNIIKFYEIMFLSGFF